MQAAKSFLIYGIAGTASRLVTLFLVPLYTRTLDIEAYGKLEFLLSAYMLAILLVGLQSESAVLREFSSARDSGEMPRLKAAALAIAFTGAALLTFLYFLAWAGGIVPPLVSQHVWLLLALATAAQVVGIQLVLLRFSNRPVLYGAVTFADVVTAAITSIFLMRGLGWGIEGALFGILAGKLVALIGSWWFSFGFDLARPSFSLISRMLSYGLPILLPAALNWVQTNGLRVLLLAFLTLADIAMASVAIRTAAIFGFVVYAFRLAWEPWAFSQLDQPKSEAPAFNDAMTLYVVAMFAVAGIIVALSPVIVRILAPERYAEAVVLCGGFVMAQAWLGIANIGAIGIHGARKTGWLTWVFAVGAVTNVAILALFTAYAGIMAAMLAALFSAIVSALVAIWVSNRLFASRYLWKTQLGALVATAVFTVTPMIIFSESAGLSFVELAPQMLAQCLSGLLVVALFAAMFISPAERKRGLEFARQQLRGISTEGRRHR